MHHSQKAWEDQELYLLGECCWMSTAMGGSGPLRPEAGGKGRQRSSKGRGQRRLDAWWGGGMQECGPDVAPSAARIPLMSVGQHSAVPTAGGC